MFYNTPASMIEKKSYRWRISFSTFKNSYKSDLDKIILFANKLKKPSVKIDVSQKKIHNTYTLNYQKIPTWNNIDITFTDFRFATSLDASGNPITNNETRISLDSKTYKSTDSYDISIKRANGKTSDIINLTETKDKDSYISAQTVFYQYLLKSGYSLTTKTIDESTIFNSVIFKDLNIDYLNIYELDNNGIPIEKWRVINPVITSVDFGNLDYATDQLMTVAVSFAYDYAELETLNLEETYIKEYKEKELRELQEASKAAKDLEAKLTDDIKLDGTKYKIDIPKELQEDLGSNFIEVSTLGEAKDVADQLESYISNKAYNSQQELKETTEVLPLSDTELREGIYEKIDPQTGNITEEPTLLKERNTQLDILEKEETKEIKDGLASLEKQFEVKREVNKQRALDDQAFIAKVDLRETANPITGKKFETMEEVVQYSNALRQEFINKDRNLSKQFDSQLNSLTEYSNGDQTSKDLEQLVRQDLYVSKTELSQDVREVSKTAYDSEVSVQKREIQQLRTELIRETDSSLRKLSDDAPKGKSEEETRIYFQGVVDEYMSRSTKAISNFESSMKGAVPDTSYSREVIFAEKTYVGDYITSQALDPKNPPTGLSLQEAIEYLILRQTRSAPQELPAQIEDPIFNIA